MQKAPAALRAAWRAAAHSGRDARVAEQSWLDGFEPMASDLREAESATDVDDTVRTHSRELLGASFSWMVLVPHDQPHEPRDDETLPSLAAILATRPPEMWPTAEEAVRAHPALSKVVSGSDASSVAVLPLRGALRPHGVLLLVFAQPYRTSSSSRRLMTRFAAEVASTLDRIDLLDVHRRVPEQLQKMLLGPPRLVLGVGHCSRYIPGSAEIGVGGDWYDVFALADGKVGVAVGDAVGHGLEAAVVMGQLRSALAGCAFSLHAPADALESLDQFARRIDAALSTTIVYAVIDTQRRTLDYCSAGHPPPLVVSPTGDARYLVDAQTWPLAVHLDGRRRTGARTDFAPGSLLVLYSDGLVERRGESLDVGLNRLASVTAKSWKLPTELLSDHLLAEMLPDRSGRDDVALLVLRSPVLSEDLFLEKSEATRESISVMRHRLAAWLAQQPLTSAQARDVLTAVGEAYTNAVDHAYGRPLTKPLARVEAARFDDRLLFTVTDTGRWRPSPRADSRGLLIMHDLMSGVDIDRRAEGTTVSLRYDLPAERRAEAG